MTFFKSLLLAIFATIFLTYVFGVSLLEFFDIDVYLNDEPVEAIKAIGVSALVMVILVLVALAIMLSVFGSIIFVVMLVFGTFVMAMIGVFWPVLLMAGVIWLFTREKQKLQPN